MKKLLGIVCVVLGFAANASAASIVGTLNFEGGVTVTATTINWHDEDGIPNLLVMTESDGYFAGMEEGLDATYASSVDLTAPQQMQDDFLRDFKEQPDVATEYDDLTFDLEDIVEPTAPECVPGAVYAVNQSCSLGVFTLTQGENNKTTIRLIINGNFDDPSLGAIDIPATGVYSTQRNETIAQIVAVFLPGGAGSFTTSYSASITAVPEPATLLTFGAGTALLAAHRRRRAKKNNNA